VCVCYYKKFYRFLLGILIKSVCSALFSKKLVVQAHSDRARALASPRPLVSRLYKWCPLCALLQ